MPLDDRERLILDMSADLKRFEKGLDRANSIADKRLTSIERRFAKMNSTVLAGTGGMAGNLNRLFATIAVGAAIREVVQYADAWTEAGNKLAAAGTPAAILASRQRELVALANQSRTALGPTVDLYARITRSSAALGVTSREVAQATDIVNKAFKAGGAASQEQASGILQLGQALSSGVLQGDELRSLRENAPLIAKAIADEFETTIGGLKKLGAEGKLTSDRVFRAIINGGADIERQFAATTPTIADSFTILRNGATQFIGELGKASGASETLSKFIVHVTENLELLAHSAVVASTVVGGVFAGQAVAGLIAQATKGVAALGYTQTAIAATGRSAAAGAAAMNGLKGAMAFLGGPWAIAIGAIAVAVGLYAMESARAAGEIDALARSNADLNAQLAETDKYLDDGAERLDGIGGAAARAAPEVDKFAGATGRAADQLYRQAMAEKTLAFNTALRVSAQAQANVDSLKIRRAAEEQQTASRVRGPMGEPGARGAMASGVSGFDPRAYAADHTPDSKAARELATAERLVREATARVEELNRAPLERFAPPRASGAGAGRTPKAGRTPAAGSENNLREATLRAEIDAARAANNEALAQSLEDQLDTERRYDAYRKAGLSVEAAHAKAGAEQTRIVAARLAVVEQERQAIADRALAEAASLAGNEDLSRELERQADVARRIADYQATGLSIEEASRRASEDQARIDAGRAEGRRRAIADRELEVRLQAAELDLEYELARELEHRRDLAELIRDYQADGLDLTAATIQAERDLLTIETARARERARYAADAAREHAIRVAGSEGRTRDASALERGAEVERRSRDYRERGGLGHDDAESRARSEVAAEAYAEAQGRFRDAFKAGLLQAIEDGDIGAALQSMIGAGLDKITDRVLGNAADAIFDTLAEAWPKLFDTGQDVLGAATAGATMSASIVSGGGTAAGLMGQAIAAAGLAVARAIAAASAAASGGDAGSAAGGFVAALFSGFAAGGGSVRAGGNYIRNERGPEPFVPTSSGVVFSQQAMRGLASLGKTAGSHGLAGDVNVEVINATGVPARAKAEKTPEGAKVTLEPMFEKGLEGAGRSGALKRAAAKSPQPTRRG